jgi:energy-coupling factor transport system ATP-binding protein
MSKLRFQSVEIIYMENTPFERPGLILDPIGLDCPAIYGIAGATGSGKSTFCKLLVGLLPGVSGHIDYPDENLGVHRQVGYVSQQPEHQIFASTVEEELCFALKNFEIPEQSWAERMQDALQRVGLDEQILGKDPWRLSGGEKRRVAIASILVFDPPILVLDEPTAGVDAQGRKILISTIQDCRKRGITVFWVTHDLRDILRYCEFCLYFKDSKIQDFGTPFDVLSKSDLERPPLLRILHEGKGELCAGELLIKT